MKTELRLSAKSPAAQGARQVGLHAAASGPKAPATRPTRVVRGCPGLLRARWQRRSFRDHPPGSTG